MKTRDFLARVKFVGWAAFHSELDEALPRKAMNMGKRLLPLIPKLPPGAFFAGAFRPLRKPAMVFNDEFRSYRGRSAAIFSGNDGRILEKWLHYFAVQALALTDVSRRPIVPGPLRCHFAGANVQCAPPPAFCFTSPGSIVQSRLDTASKIEPAAPSGGTPTSARVA
jgi:hypothetical protein